MTAAFVHLRLHSEYSLVDSLVRVDELVEHTARLGMPAVAMTDFGNLFGLIKFYQAANSAGIKPIAGADVLVGESGGEFPLTLLIADNTGYRNLLRLLSRGWLEGQHLGKPVLSRAWMEQCSAGLIALSGGRDGAIGQALLAGRIEQAEQLLRGWMALFPGRFYVELSRAGRALEEDYLHLAVALAERCACPVVATNDVRFIAREDFEAHEARVCIHDGRMLGDPRRPRTYSPQQYLRTPEEMAALFADIPEAIENAVEIARRCTLALQLGKYHLPDFPVPGGGSPEQYLERLAGEGLDARLAALRNPAATAEQYRERLAFELATINTMGFAGYFLIVMDFIRWARRNGVPVGPGRGSGAGSVAAWALGITDLDPLAYQLLFERFLNPERVSMPDFES